MSAHAQAHPAAPAAPLDATGEAQRPGSSAAPLHAQAASYLRTALSAAELRSEHVLSYIRLAFCTLVAVRFLGLHLLHRQAEQRAYFVLAATGLGIAFSLAMIAAIRSARPVLPALLLASVVLDAALCTTALASNVFWPWPEYRGLLSIPDTMAYLVMVAAAGYRSSRLALVGALVNAAGLALLLFADVRNPQVAYGASEIWLCAVVMAASAALSIAGARRAEQLVLQAADYGLKTARAKQGMSVVLQEHHDAMSLLTAALFAARDLEGSERAPEALSALRRDLEGLRYAIAGIKEEALGGVVALDDPIAVDAVATVGGYLQVYERLVGPMRVRWELAPTAMPVRIAGGEMALRRVLVNLLVNAREGDGVRASTVATVRAYSRDAFWFLIVEDDGPGLRSNAAKPHGTGSGLRFVRAVAEASAGSFSLEDSANGAIATLKIPNGTARPA